MARHTAGKRRWEPEAVDPREVLERLRLTTGRAARLCGVTRRQLCYWTDQGIIEALPPDGDAASDPEDGALRTYDAAALHKVLLLKRSLAKGLAVRRAAAAAEAEIEQSRETADRLRACSPEERRPFLAEQAERLDALAQRLQSLALSADRNRMEGVAPRAEALSEVCGRILGNGTAMHEDADECLEVAVCLGRLETALTEVEDGGP